MGPVPSYNPGMLRVIAPLTFLLLSACATSSPVSSSPPNATIAAEQYEAVFDRAKQVLRDANFTIDRVDARRGVITTEATPSVGLITPWLGHHRTDGEAWQGFVHHEQRRATVLFEPAGGEPEDLRTFDGEIAFTVRVDVERIEQPGRRHDASGILFTSTSPKLEDDRSIGGTPVAVVRRTDVPFSDFLTARIVELSER